MPDCLRTDIRDVLPDWVHGSLDAGAAAAVANHVASCAACTAEAELLRAVRGVLGEPRIDVDRIAAAVVERTAATRTPVRSGGQWRTVLGGLAVAASIALALLLVRENGERAPVGPVASTDTTDTIPSPRIIVAMPDDSMARIDTGGVGQSDTAPGIAPTLPDPEMRLAATEIQVTGGLADLEVDQLEALLQRLDTIEALPQTSPTPLFTPDLEVH